MATSRRFLSAFATAAMFLSAGSHAAPPAPPPAPPAPSPMAESPALSASPDLLSAPIGSSAAAFKNRHLSEFAVTEARFADFYMGVWQGLPAFVIYTHDADRITGKEFMVSGARDAMGSFFQKVSADFAAPGSMSQQTIECRDAGSKTTGWRLEENSVLKSKTETLSYREDPTNHAVVLATASPAGMLSIDLLNKAYADLLARADLRGNAYAQQWLAAKNGYDDVSRSKGLYGCRMSRGGAPSNLPLKFDVALTQAGAQVVNGVIDIPTPEQFGGLNFAGFQAVLSAGKVAGLRFAGNVPQSVFYETLKKTASNLGDPVTLVSSNNGAQTQVVATFRPTQDPKARRLQTILTYRAPTGGVSGTLLFDIH